MTEPRPAERKFTASIGSLGARLRSWTRAVLHRDRLEANLERGGLSREEAGRQARQETSYRSCRSQTGRHPASHLANRKSLAGLSARQTN
jgi:hypothetical protein